MALSYDLISQFAKQVAKNDRKTKTESTVYGTVVTDGNGDKYVKIDGSDQLTPLWDTSANVNKDERVSVLIKNHTATVTGNISSPAARTGDVESIGDQVSEIQKFDILIGERIEANEGYIKNLQADMAQIGELKAATAEIGELVAKKADIEELNAAKATIEDLKSTKIDADIVNAQFATIKSLEATTARVGTIEGNYSNFEKAVTGDLTAVKGDITDLKTDRITASQVEANYANIDFANITEATIRNFFTKTGMIENVTIGDSTITGALVGVTIKGDLIEAETLKADKLVVKGNDGIFYKLNIEYGDIVGTEAVPDDSLHGSVITAKSITAEKVSVHDLVAFGADIAGLHMKSFDTHSAIYSGEKESVDNTTEGFYMDSQGQLALGDANNYLKYFKDTDGSYKLIISSVDKLEIGGRNLLIGSSTGNGWNYGGFDVNTNTFTIQNGINTISDTTLTVYSSNTTVDGTTLDISDISSTVSDNLLTINPSTQWVSIRNQEVPVTLEANRDYTLSFHIKRDSPISTANLRIMDVDPNVSEDIILERTGIVFEVGSFVKYQVTFTPEETHTSSAIIQFDLSGSSSGVTTLSIKDIKLEVGNKATDYTPAPEDLEWKAREADGEVRQFVTEQSTSIIQDCEKIVQTAVGEYVHTDEFGQYKRDVTSQFSQTDREIRADFNTTLEPITGEKGIASRFTKLEKHIVMDQNGVLLYAKENGEDCPLRLRIDNDEICFEKDGKRIAWWDGDYLHTGNIEVETSERAQFGNFAFIPFEDGSLKFLKVQ